ncbi:hypothetical protein SEA_JUMBO_89 [Gordonia phage Jumbo]|uniref:Uncharacterized protein n=1 Tax=Gordonia phage Jumbo TaxID=1887650 RepID=A0A1B3B0P6_9CAUD|nr:hypothetical protein BIZ69_gp089 [Gordonia phage Jumbo]AOE44597.1 hypothetical protein SEA_JUMBO_89 [Gordonia phage Jumbo]
MSTGNMRDWPDFDSWNMSQLREFASTWVICSGWSRMKKAELIEACKSWCKVHTEMKGLLEVRNERKSQAFDFWSRR